MVRRYIRTLSVFIPKKRVHEELVERLTALGKERERSINYLVVQAISEFLDREDKKTKS